MGIQTLYRLANNRSTAQLSVSRFMQAANGMRYDAPHQVGNMAMLRSPSENSFSGLPSNIQTRGHDPAMESETLMERKMSSQTFVHTNVRRSSFVGSALGTLARHIIDGLSAIGRRFMEALYELRQRQANEVIRRHRHLIDDCND